jgi:glycosyltransferase involved in cell wall biosynthesis
MSPPLVSCIVPVFNGERYLREALDSILGQTHRALEIIVVDDGSTDGTAAIVAGYRESVRYRWQPNAGPATARNTGIRAAIGEFIAFLDADDLWHPKKLATQLDGLAERPELGACVTHIQNFWAPELSREAEHFRDHPRAQAMPGYSSVTLLARREVFDRVGLFDTTLKHGDDTEWFFRASERGVSVDVVPEVLVYRRLHERSRSRRWAPRSRDEYIGLLKARLDRRRAREQTG